MQPKMQPELQNGHQQHQHQHQQIQSAGMQLSHYDHTSAAASAASSDDFFDQMLSTLPSTWPELGNHRSPWDLVSSNPNSSAGDAASSQKLFSIPLAGSASENSAAPYDDSSLLASRLRQQQISGDGGSPSTVKPMLLHLTPHQQHQQQQMILSAMGRSPPGSALGVGGGGELGLLPLPLCLGSGGSDDVNASFKSTNSTGSESLYDGFGGTLQGAQHHFQNAQQGASTQAQSYGGAPAASPAGGGAAPPRQRVRARRGQATDPHSIAERLRRERIAERMKALQELVPNANKTDKASMLDEIIDYVKFLQLQVKVLSMSRLGGAAAVAPLVADNSSEACRGGGGSDSLAMTEHQVAKLMEEDMGSAMQYLQGKGLCLMPISLASAISTATSHPRSVGGGGGGLFGATAGLIPPPPAAGDGPPSPTSMSVLTVQSAMANGGDAVKDAASVSKP